MLGRTVSVSPSALAPRAAAAAAWQLAALILLTLGSLTLALSQAPLPAAAPQGAVAGLFYDAAHLLTTAQGLGHAPASSWAWLNPGADLDASVSTDGEDIAAPIADVAEFRSKDAFLAVDALFGGAAALNAGVAGGSAVLATALAQDYL